MTECYASTISTPRDEEGPPLEKCSKILRARADSDMKGAAQVGSVSLVDPESEGREYEDVLIVDWDRSHKSECSCLSLCLVFTLIVAYHIFSCSFGIL